MTRPCGHRKHLAKDDESEFIMFSKTLIFIIGMGMASLAWAEKAQEQASALDDQSKSFVVVGYSTSFIWPHMLQSMLDEHAAESGVYHVLNAVVGGSPVVRWLKGDERYERTYGKMLKDYFSDDGKRRGDRPKPTVALLQQSLQGVFEGRGGGIRGPDDHDRIKKGADAFQKLAEQLHEDGIQVVYIATHIYKVSMEPSIENEKYALEALLKRSIHYIRTGPELWMPTKAVHPSGFSAVDKVHPSVKGARIMAEGWYRALAGDTAKQEVVDSMYKNPFPELVKSEEQREKQRAERRQRR